MSNTDYKKKVNKLKWLTPSLIVIYFLLTLLGVLIQTSDNNYYYNAYFATLLLYCIPLLATYTLDNDEKNIRIISIVLYSIIGLFSLYTLITNKISLFNFMKR